MKKIRNVLIFIEVLLMVIIICRFSEDKLYKSKCCEAAESTSVQVQNSTEADKIKKVALTFDDGPNKTYTEELLEGLAAKNVKATFFLIGKKAEANPEIVKDIWKGGHLIGNHSYDHVNLYAMSDAEACEQIRKTNEVIENITGETPEYLRPPFGCYKKKIDEEMNMIEILWDVDPRDWSDRNTGDIVNRVVTKVKENDIILLHDGYATSVAAALQIVDILKGEGYDFVTVDELILE